MRNVRVMQRSFAVGWAGMLGWVMVPGAAAGAGAEEERADHCIKDGKLYRDGEPYP